MAYVGPGLLVAVGYMDPGNWATDIAGGAQFGYTLLSVILISNLFAIVLQHCILHSEIVSYNDALSVKYGLADFVTFFCFGAVFFFVHLCVR